MTAGVDGGRYSMLKALNINKKRFSLIAGIGSIGLTLILLILLLTNSAIAAFPIAGIGGIVIEADEISGTHLKISTHISSTSEHDDWGQARVELGTANIAGLYLSKKIDLEGALSEYGVKDLDIVITPAPGSIVTGNQLTLGITGLTATYSDFRNLRVDENRSANDPIDVFHLSANSLLLNNPKLNTHLLSAESITIPGLKVKLIINKNDGTTIGGF